MVIKSHYKNVGSSKFYNCIYTFAFAITHREESYFSIIVFNYRFEIFVYVIIYRFIKKNITRVFVATTKFMKNNIYCCCFSATGRSR